MAVVFLSPHLDDAVYSCGGLIASISCTGRIPQVWTLFAGSPRERLSPFAKELHKRWQSGPEAVSLRRNEDSRACMLLGAKFVHLDNPDCIYRFFPGSKLPVIQKNEDLFTPGPLAETELISRIVEELAKKLPGHVELYCPLGLGGHIDHRITRTAAELLGIPLVYYADFPYAAKDHSSLKSILPEGAVEQRVVLDETAIQRWIAGVGQYRSQLSSFWQSEAEMASAVRSYAMTPAGSTVWTFA